MSADPKNKEKKDKPLTPEQEFYIKKLGIKPALKGVNPLSYESLNDVVNYFKDNRDIELDQIQDEENPYKLFTKALNKGLFQGNGKNAVKFLKGLKGGAEESKIAKKFISDLAHGGEQTSAAKEKEALKKMDEARSQNEAQNAQNKVKSALGVITESSGTWEKFSKILDASERTQINYRPEKLPEKLVTEIKDLTAFNTAKNETERLEVQLNLIKKSGDFNKNKTKQELAKMYEKQLAALDKKTDELVFKILGEKGDEVTPEIAQKFSQKILQIGKESGPYIEREFSRSDELRNLSQKLGVQNINNTKTFSVKKEGKDGQIRSTERERIRIKEISFEKEDSDPEVVGHPNIKFSYIDREGQESKVEEMSDLNFERHFINLLDGYEDETLAKTPKEKDYMPEVGDVFSSAKLGQFKVVDIKNGKIITDKELTAVSKESLGRNAKNNEELYQDQRKKEFNKKEFVKLLLIHSCSKDGGGGRNNDGSNFMPDEILEEPMYPESLKKPAEEGEKEVKDIEDKVGKEAEEEIKKQLIMETDDEDEIENKTKPKPEDIVNENVHDYWEEALPYDKVHRVNNMEMGTPEGPLKMFYNQTRFLSVSDIFHLVKACWDFHMRKFERNQKEKYSSIAKNLPYFGSEMERVHQAAENEEVHQFKESYEHKGITFILDRMRITTNKDEMKACFEVLVHKGQMRFEDIEIWENMNRFLPHTKAIPIPRNGDPNTIIEDKDKHSPYYMKTGISVLEGGVDLLWGPGTYGEWFAQNKSTYASGCKKFYEEGKQLEGVEGEHTRRLEELLREHKEGNFVDPQEFEGLILHSIEAGKVDLETKIYYMVAGVTAENNEGRTLLPYDRIAHINSEMLTRFPIMEYMCSKVPRLLPDGKTTKLERMNLNDYRNWLNYFDNGNHHNCAPTQNVTKFIWKYCIPSEKTHTRINKALRNADGMDHDDMHAYLPPASTQVLTDACKTVGGGGGKHLLTIEGYANAVAGFSEYMRNLAPNGQTKQLGQAFCSYVRYEGILLDKYDKGKEGLIRMDNRTLNKRCVVTTTPPKVFMVGLNELVLKVAEKYDRNGQPKLLKLVKLTRQDTSDWDLSLSKYKQKNAELQQAYNTFDAVFESTIKSDGGKIMLEVSKEMAALGNEGGLPDLGESPYEKVGGELKTMDEWF